MCLIFGSNIMKQNREDRLIPEICFSFSHGQTRQNLALHLCTGRPSQQTVERPLTTALVRGATATPLKNSGIPDLPARLRKTRGGWPASPAQSAMTPIIFCLVGVTSEFDVLSLESLSRVVVLLLPDRQTVRGEKTKRCSTLLCFLPGRGSDRRGENRRGLGGSEAWLGSLLAGGEWKQTDKGQLSGLIIAIGKQGLAKGGIHMSAAQLRP